MIFLSNNNVTVEVNGYCVALIKVALWVVVDHESGDVSVMMNDPENDVRNGIN